MRVSKTQTYARWSCIREPLEQGKFPFGFQLRAYAAHVLGRVTPTRSMLTFVLSLLPEDVQLAALRLVRRRVETPARGKPARQATRAPRNLAMGLEDCAGEISRLLRKCRCMSVTTDVEVYLRACIERDQVKYVKAEGVHICGRMADLQHLFGLSDGEMSLLSALLCYSISRSFGAFVDSVCVQEKRELIAILTGLAMQELACVTGRKGRLVRAGVLDVPDHWSDSSFYRIAPEIRDHLLGIGEESLALKFATAAAGARFTPENFGLPEEAVQIATGLLRSNLPCSILLHGVPGTGKTEFAKALAATCRKQAYFVSHSVADGLQNGRVAVEAVTAAYQANEFLVVVDEADELLNLQGTSGSPFFGRSKGSLAGKSWLNDFLDRCQAQVLWLTNEVESIDESSMRRFAYNIPFRRQSAGRRQDIWREHLRGSSLQSLVSAADVADMARTFRVGAAGIANAVQNAARIVPAGTTDSALVLRTLRELLASHERLTGRAAEEKLAGLSTQYDPGAVCTDVPVEGIVAGLASCGVGRQVERPPVNLLFWGPPGTGKSAFALFLAQSLDKELICRRASDLLNMYVGGTERNIRDAFEHANREDAILLLDEADSFFIDRNRAQRSWETSQTNELLNQMEHHHGILICCTNLLESLDHAVLRRFVWKVRFQAPTAEGRQRIYRRYFDSPDTPIPEESLAHLARLADLTPGDMKAVWMRFRVRPPAAWNHADIVQALSEEVAYRRQKSIVTGFRG